MRSGLSRPDVTACRSCGPAGTWPLSGRNDLPAAPGRPTERARARPTPARSPPVPPHDSGTGPAPAPPGREGVSPPTRPTSRLRRAGPRLGGARRIAWFFPPTRPFPASPGLARGWRPARAGPGPQAPLPRRSREKVRADGGNPPREAPGHRTHPAKPGKGRAGGEQSHATPSARHHAGRRPPFPRRSRKEGGWVGETPAQRPAPRTATTTTVTPGPRPGPAVRRAACGTRTAPATAPR